MIKRTRSVPAPASLSSGAAKTEADAAENHYKNWKVGDPKYGTFEHYKNYEVVERLWADFNNKCAYCEGPVEKGTSQVEHYRPKGSIKDSDHCGYWWLAHEWTNLLPTCPPCNTALLQHIVTPTMSKDEVEAMQAKPPKASFGKATNFPVKGDRLKAKSHDHHAEQPYILDPTRDNPQDALSWSHGHDYSVLVPAEAEGVPSLSGRETIDCLALNRLGLVVARTQELNTLKTQWISIKRDLQRATDDPANFGLHVGYAVRRVDDLRAACAEDKHYSAMATAFVAAVSEELHAWVAAHPPLAEPTP